MQHQNVLVASVGPNGVPAATAAPGGGTSQFPSTSLYVGDLDFSVTDSQLYELFKSNEILLLFIFLKIKKKLIS